MPHIEQLPPHVADLIAAGEVVERPASAVKELVENALDAGASAVAVELRRGGMALLRVSDNGCGIDPQELPSAFLRHATSKLRTPEDLGKIATLGFRGEALAAIAAVSRLSITSKTPRGDAATLFLEGGVPGEIRPCGAPEGTTVSVQDLFFNTPARLKFMRKDSAETAAVAGLLQHLALSRPDVSFRFTKDGTDALHTPGDGRLDSAILASLGRDFLKTLLPVKGKDGAAAVEGYVTQPLQSRGSRAMQTFFVNGRLIKSQLLTAALEEAYRDQIMKGRFPGCVLFLTLPVTTVDVNVHPAKTQVKFAREQEVFHLLYHTVQDALLAQGVPPEAKPLSPRQEFFQSMDAKTFRQKTAPAEPGKTARRETPRQKTPSKPSPEEPRRAEPSRGAVFDGGESFAYRTLEEPPPEKKPSLGPPPPSALSRGGEPLLQKPPPAIPGTGEPPEEGQEVLSSFGGASPWRIAGEVLRTYIVCESEEGDVYLIDKHAAHERVNYDRLQRAQEEPMAQRLLQPVTAEVRQEDGALLLENLPLLSSLGLQCEDFGGGTLLVREAPEGVAPEEIPALLEALAADLRQGRTFSQQREAVLHTMACKAAIKGGWKSGEEELQVLVEKVQKGEIRFCPHGRPVAVKISQREIEKLFKRA